MWSVCLKDTCHNNPKKSSSTKKTKHLASVYSLFTYRWVDETKNSLENYRDQDCMKNNCKNLKKHVTKIINYEQRNDTNNLWRK